MRTYAFAVINLVSRDKALLHEIKLYHYDNMSMQYTCCTANFNRGIKHDFLFINIRKVPREVLKTEGEARDFQPSRGTLQMLWNDKILFDRCYCINSTKTLRQ